MILQPAPTARTVVSGAAGNERDKLSKAARDFEAIFVRQMLAAARKTDFGGEGQLFDGQALATFRQMQDDRFAQIAADRGILGIGRLLEGRLTGRETER